MSITSKILINVFNAVFLLSLLFEWHLLAVSCVTTMIYIIADEFCEAIKGLKK